MVGFHVGVPYYRCNQPKSLSGIETINGSSTSIVYYPVAINLNPYQGLKPDNRNVIGVSRLSVAIHLNPYQGLKHFTQGNI